MVANLYGVVGMNMETKIRIKPETSGCTSPPLFVVRGWVFFFEIYKQKTVATTHPYAPFWCLLLECGECWDVCGVLCWCWCWRLVLVLAGGEPSTVAPPHPYAPFFGLVFLWRLEANLLDSLHGEGAVLDPLHFLDFAVDGL